MIDKKAKRDAYMKAYRAKNREKLLAQERARYASNPDHRAKTRARNKAWREANPERFRELTKAYHLTNAEKMRATSAAWYAANKDRAAETSRRAKLRRYGLTPQAYAMLLAKQHYRCAICPAMHGTGKKALHVDHCHRTNGIRGLLCHSCNAAMGLLKDDPTILAAALQYLKSSGASGAISTMSSDQPNVR
jgi:hypothetical protein